MIHIWTSLCVMHEMKKSKIVSTLVRSGFNSFIKIMLAVTIATSIGQKNISKPSRDCAVKYLITKRSMDSVQIHCFFYHGKQPQLELSSKKVYWFCGRFWYFRTWFHPPRHQTITVLKFFVKGNTIVTMCMPPGYLTQKQYFRGPGLFDRGCVF